MVVNTTANLVLTTIWAAAVVAEEGASVLEMSPLLEQRAENDSTCRWRISTLWIKAS
jgi:hypothetical protein